MFWPLAFTTIGLLGQDGSYLPEPGRLSAKPHLPAKSVEEAPARFRNLLAARRMSLAGGNRAMQSRRHFLGTAAATLALPFTKVRLAQASQRTILNDASRLSPTPVAKHVTISKPAQDDLIARIRAELKEAAEANRPFAASVARHSMGGQSLPRDGTAITLDGGALEMDTAAKTYRTTAGNRWSDVIRILDRKSVV